MASLGHNGLISGSDLLGLFQPVVHYSDVNMSVTVSQIPLQLDYLFNSLIRFTTRNALKLCISVPLWWESTRGHGFPSQRVSSCHHVLLGYTIRSCYNIHYSDVIMSPIASEITDVSIVYSTVCWGADQRKHRSSAPLAFVRGIHWWQVNSPHKGPVTRKMFPFDDVIMGKFSPYSK